MITVLQYFIDIDILQNCLIDIDIDIDIFQNHYIDIDIFGIALSILISISIFFRIALLISISISIFSKMTISIYRQSIFDIDLSNRAIVTKINIPSLLCSEIHPILPRLLLFRRIGSTKKRSTGLIRVPGR